MIVRSKKNTRTTPLGPLVLARARPPRAKLRARPPDMKTNQVTIFFGVKDYKKNGPLGILTVQYQVLGCTIVGT